MKATRINQHIPTVPFANKLVTIIGGLAFIMSAFAFATPKPETVQPEKHAHIQDMQEQKHAFFDSLYVNKNSAPTGLKKIYVEPAEAVFSRYWERDHRSDVSRIYKSKTLKKYAQLLTTKLTEVFDESDAFQVVSDQKDAELILRPKLDELNIFAPHDRIGKSFVFRAGIAKYDLQIIDAKNNTVYFHFIDKRETHDKSFTRPIQASRVSNRRDFGMLMEKWGKRTVKYLESSLNRPS